MSTQEERLSQKLNDSIGGLVSQEEALKDIYTHIQSTPGMGDTVVVSKDDRFPTRNIIDPGLDVNERIRLADRALKIALARKRSASGSGDGMGQLTRGQSAVAIATILKDPEKFGFTEEGDLEKLMETAWYVSGASDQLDPETIKDSIQKEKADAHNKRLKEAEDLSETGSLKGVHEKRRLEKEGVPTVDEKELLNERRRRSISYYENLATDKRAANSASNTSSELRVVETALIAHAAGKFAKNSNLAESAKNIIDSSSKVSELMSKGGTAIQMFRDPEGFLATKLAKKLGVESISKAVSAKVSAAIIARFAGTALSALMGTVAPIIGNIIGFIVGQVLNKFIVRGISLAKRAATGAVAVAGGIAILLTQGVASAANVAAASAVGSVAIMAAFLALIMFIINSGGYIVPPGPNLGSGPSDDNNIGGGGDPTVTENQYIRVVKRPSPGGPFPNPAPGSRRVVDYTIEITALESELTEVTFLYKCEAIKEGDAILNCPENNPEIPESPPSQTIPTGAPFIIRYSVAYDSAYSDSVVMDSLLVTATVPGRTTRASGFASIVFGTPPTRCFDLVGDWPQREQSIMLAAVAQINRAPLFVQKICSRTRVNLRYNPTQAVFQGKPYGGFTSYPNIEFYPLALRNYNSAFYTLSHEMGHIIANTTTLLSQFREAAPYNSGGFICTYPFRYPLAETNQSEDFAEMIAQYYMGQSLSSETRDFTCMNGGNLLTRYRSHFNFALLYVFDNEEMSWVIPTN